MFKSQSRAFNGQMLTAAYDCSITAAHYLVHSTLYPPVSIFITFIPSPFLSSSHSLLHCVVKLQHHFHRKPPTGDNNSDSPPASISPENPHRAQKDPSC